MSCFDASGVRSIKLYENKGIRYIYTDAVTLDTIVTQGITVHVTSDLKPDYSNSQIIGSNFKLMNNHTVTFFNYDLIEGLELQETLNNVYGWIAAITFNSGQMYAIQSPLYFKENTQLTTLSTHTWKIELGSEVTTQENLITYLDIPPGGIGVMAIQTTFIVG